MLVVITFIRASWHRSEGCEIVNREGKRQAPFSLWSTEFISKVSVSQLYHALIFLISYVMSKIFDSFVYAEVIPMWLLWNTALSTQNMNYSFFLFFSHFSMFILVTVSVFCIRVEYVSVCCDTVAMLYLKLITLYDKSLWKSYMRLLYTIVAGWKLEKGFFVNVVLLVKCVLISYSSSMQL
jgi:hypothetical protein